MPIHITWGNPEHTVILQEFQGRWNINDLHTAFDQTNEMKKSVPHTVNFICDLRQSGMPSGNFLSVVRRLERQPSNIGRTIMVGANHYIKTLGEVFKTISPSVLKTFFFVGTLEEAWALIEAEKQDSA
ncbi:MAG: hypothetical protein JNM70_07430 [Anaerolineae bacterium]|nr:hypothetical protein [Anaerolineae bacterium]